MRNKKRGILFSLVFMIVFSPLFTAYSANITLDSKNILFHIDDNSGSFYIQDPNPVNKRMVNLLFNDNPPTSYITLILNGKPFRLNSADFTKQEHITLNGDSIQARFYKDKVEFEIKVFITNSSPNIKKDSVMMLISVVNREKKRVTVGSRFLLDTTYDEKKGKPRIYLDSTEKVNRERLIVKSMIPEFIFSGEYSGEVKNFGNGLYIFPQVNSLAPESIIIGNWKKLDDNELDYKVKPGDQFRASQYGSKDAAIGIFFKSIPVKSGEKVTFGIMLSMNQMASDQLDDVEAVEKVSKIKTPQTQQKVPQRSNSQDHNIPAVNSNNTQQQTPLDNTSDQPALVITNTVFVPAGNSNGGVSNAQYQQLLQSQIQLLEKMNNIVIQLETLSNQKALAPRIVTNIIEPSEDMVPKTEMIELRDTYESQMKNVEKKYQALIDQQKRELEAAVLEYEGRLKDSTTKKNKVEAVNQLDQTIRELDQKIKVIEELEKLRLDFKTMPQEKLDALYDMLGDLEKKLIKIQYK